MKIIEDAITTLVKEGRLTLQVPMFSIGPADEENAPDEWFCTLNTKRKGMIPAKKGFLFLSKTGYEANKELLKSKFDTTRRGHTWEDFEKHVEEHFASVQIEIENEIKKKEKEIEQLRNFKL